MHSPHRHRSSFFDRPKKGLGFGRVGTRSRERRIKERRSAIVFARKSLVVTLLCRSSIIIACLEAGLPPTSGHSIVVSHMSKYTHAETIDPFWSISGLPSLKFKELVQTLMHLILDYIFVKKTSLIQIMFIVIKVLLIL